MDIYEITGVVGFITYITAYALLQAGRLDGNRVGYTLLNLLAASLVLFSLTDQFNLASALIQLSWIAISLWGLSKLLLSNVIQPGSAGRSVRQTFLSHRKIPIREVVMGQVKLWRLRFAVQRERELLRDMGDHLLQDIGISRSDAEIEAHKPFKDVPVKRLREDSLPEAGVVGMGTATGSDRNIPARLSVLGLVVNR